MKYNIYYILYRTRDDPTNHYTSDGVKITVNYPEILKYNIYHLSFATGCVSISVCLSALFWSMFNANLQRYSCFNTTQQKMHHIKQ